VSSQFAQGRKLITRCQLASANRIAKSAGDLLPGRTGITREDR
jgi:hypothetical protein